MDSVKEEFQLFHKIRNTGILSKFYPLMMTIVRLDFQEEYLEVVFLVICPIMVVFPTMDHFCPILIILLPIDNRNTFWIFRLKMMTVYLSIVVILFKVYKNKNTTKIRFKYNKCNQWLITNVEKACLQIEEI